MAHPKRSEGEDCAGYDPAPSAACEPRHPVPGEHAREHERDYDRGVVSEGGSSQQGEG